MHAPEAVTRCCVAKHKELRAEPVWFVRHVHARSVRLGIADSTPSSKESLGVSPRAAECGLHHYYRAFDLPGFVTDEVSIGFVGEVHAAQGCHESTHHASKRANWEAAVWTHFPMMRNSAHVGAQHIPN